MTTPLFSLKDLRVQLGQKLIYDGFSLDLPEVGITGLIGPNGCGKSTLLKCLAGVLAPSAGHVHLRGTALSDIKAGERAKRLAFLPQEPAVLPELSVEGLVAKGRTPWRQRFMPLTARDQDAIRRALEATGMADLRKRRLGTLSGGQRQRAWLALALAQETDVILLDEPTSFLDLPHQLQLLQLLNRLAKDEGRRIVMVLHDLTLAGRFCDHLVALKDGQQIETGTPAQTLSAQTISALYGVRAKIAPDPVFGAPVVYPLD